MMRQAPRPAGPDTDDGTDEARPRPDPRETADYVADLSGELATLAKAAGLDLLAYLLEMAQLEARGTAGPPSRSDGRR